MKRPEERKVSVRKEKGAYMLLRSRSSTWKTVMIDDSEKIHIRPQIVHSGTALRSRAGGAVAVAAAAAAAALARVRWSSRYRAHITSSKPPAPRYAKPSWRHGATSKLLSSVERPAGLTG